MVELLDELKALAARGQEAFEKAPNQEALERVRIEYLGRSGKLKVLLGRIKDIPNEDKRAAGQRMNEIKATLTAALKASKEALGEKPSGTFPDPTLPGVTQPRGSRHPLTQTIEKIAAIFERMGFTIADGPEVEDDFHNFDALNIPRDHPARDSFDTFFLDDGRILRSQTSTVQIRVMEKTRPPIRIIAPGRVYRPDAVDATHHYGFHQLEGLAVDEGITFADLKGVLEIFARELFGEETGTRFRPSFFPFTEPSAEVDVSCIFCRGEGCRVCKGSGWIEILGCGMVDPNVFEAINRRRGEVVIDPEKYTGFAFGLGIERIAMLSLGVDDIRRFSENDLRFLRQF